MILNKVAELLAIEMTDRESAALILIILIQKFNCQVGLPYTHEDIFWSRFSLTFMGTI